MVRQSVNTKPWIKNLELYKDFSGGANTSVTDSSLLDHELTFLKNVDIDPRGTIKRRTGMKTYVSSVGGKGQGFFIYRQGDIVSALVARNGRLYSYSQDPLDGSYGILAVEGRGVYGDVEYHTFQNEHPVDAVMFNGKLYVATGDPNLGLLEYDGLYTRVVQPYKVNGLEALYIGTNGLEANPDTVVQDGEAAFLRVDGVIPTNLSNQFLTYGVLKSKMNFRVVTSKPSGAVLEYKFQRKKLDADTWVVVKDWHTNSINEWTPPELGEYELKFEVRIQGDTTIEEGYIPRFIVKETNQENDAIERYDRTELLSCNRILVHWQRLIMYNDRKDGKSKFYVSEIDNPGYFPMGNTLSFEIGHNDKLTNIIPYRDMLVVFKENSIQAVYGNGPIGDNAYRRVVLNTTIGCATTRGATVVGNHIFFYSREGVYRLKSLGYVNDQANVEKMDDRINNLVPKNSDKAISFYYNNEFHLIIGDKRFRYYTNLNAWVYDESIRFEGAVAVMAFENNTYLLSERLNTYNEGTAEEFSILESGIYHFEDDVFDDAGYVFETIIETKMYDFGQPHHPKKLKELQLLLGAYEQHTNLKLYVYADNQAIISPDTSRAIIVDGAVVWQSSSESNVIVPGGTVFGSWEMGLSPFGTVDSMIHYVRLTGMCRRTKISLVHQEATPMSLLGLGYIFKVKRA